MAVYKPPAVKAPRKAPNFHAHGCLTCGRRFMDTCEEPFGRGRCGTCRTGNPPPIWDIHREAQPCCVDSRKITDTSRLTAWALAGHTDWWQCPSCGRTHPYDPSIILTTRPAPEQEDTT